MSSSQNITVADLISSIVGLVISLAHIWKPIRTTTAIETLKWKVTIATTLEEQLDKLNLKLRQ